MVLLTKCSFCGETVKKGTGKLYVKSDGSVYLFCSGKCESNLIKLERDPAKIVWTEGYRDRKREKKAHKDKKQG